MNRVLKMVATGILILATGAGCSAFGRSDQEVMGEGIVRGTLGAHPDWQARLEPTGATTVAGQVVELEGGAYVIQQPDGIQQRLSHDENTRIDRPAHVGDNIQAWVDDRGRTLLIRNIDHE
ncbi:MAG TPA: hypothetical protein VKP13_07140 [Nitrospira sp.]|nr:hypothetical protein [Nitrospira sp.]